MEKEIEKYLDTLSKKELKKLLTNIYSTVKYSELVNFRSLEEVEKIAIQEGEIIEPGFYCLNSGENFLGD